MSLGTHDRFVTHNAEQQKQASIWSELSPEIFRVASVDNIDWLQSHAAVYCKGQHRSYHGTTIQIVQPVPSINLSTTILSAGMQNQPIIHTRTPTSQDSSHIKSLRGTLMSAGKATPSIGSTDVHRTLQPVAEHAITSCHKRHSSLSPANSPHKHGKVGPKRMRTINGPSRVKPFASNKINMHNINSAVVYNRPELRLELVKELDSETNSKKQLSKQVFAYFLQKHAQGRSESGDVIKPLREFLLPTPAQLADNDASSVYYMDLLDESADSEETLAEFAEMLSENIGLSHKGG